MAGVSSMPALTMWNSSQKIRRLKSSSSARKTSRLIRKGFKGVAIFKLGGKAERITLAPSEKNSLSGTAATALPANPKGAVQLTAPDGKTATARFD